MIRPTFMAFETAKRALNISQAGLDTVGHNISNAKTAGFTRQRVDQVSLSMGGKSQKYQVFGAANAGMGSNLQGISQVRDPYLDNRYRTEASANGELGVKQNGLTDINNIFDEIMTDGLYSQLGDSMTALNELGSNADSKEFAMVARDEISALASILNKNARQLEEAREQQKTDLKVTVEQDINNIIKKIADLNVRIQEDNFYGNPSNELNDARNLLIDNLSEFADIKVVRTPVKLQSDNIVEHVSIELKGTAQPPVKLIDSGFYNQLGVTEDPATGKVGISLIDSISGQSVDDNLATQFTKGGIKGYLDILNGQGPNAETGENTYRGIPYYQKSLDEYAKVLAETFNRVNNITEAQAKSSGSAPYPPTVTAPTPPTVSALSWVKSVETGTPDFANKAKDVAFTFDSGTNKVTAVSDGVTYTGSFDPLKPTDPIKFEDTDGNLGFTVSPSGPPIDSSATIKSGTMPLLVATTDKNLLVPLVPTVTDTTTGEKPAWIDTIHGKSIEFSGKDYAIDFTFDDATGAMTAKMADGQVYTGTFAGNGTVDFRADGGKGAIMFSVKTTTEEPAATSSVKVDAKISAKNIAVASSWFEDSLYITTTKKNPVNEKSPKLGLSGTSNPSWLNSVAIGPDGVGVKNGTYSFTATGAPPMLKTTINGVEYSGEYKASDTIQLKGGTPEKIGLIVQTNGKPFGATIAENSASIVNTSGAASDNISKLMTEIGSSNNFEISGINGDLQQFLISYHAQMGTDKNVNGKNQDASFAVISGFADRRDAISSVSIDEEGINMMTYQNYYNAAARYMTTLDEALDKIINGMGMVGR